VLFGATGDLAQTLLFPALYRLEERGNLQIPILGVGRSDWDDAQLHQRIGESVHGALGDIDRAVLERLDRRSHFLRGDYDEGSTYAGVRRCLGAPAAEHAAYYLAIPPALFTTVSDGLGGAGLNRNSRLVVEKPFGHDSASAAALSTELGRTFPPEQILRVDHFLGKDALGDLLALRFSNRFLDPLLNRAHVRSVQITFAETMDVAERGGFYDAVGALRDVVQNHLFQVLAHLTMEAPVDNSPAAIADQRRQLLAAVPALRDGDLVRGQYRGYDAIAGVAPHSRTETYVALRLSIDNDRWRGVPIAIRTGKCLPTDLLEVIVTLAPAPWHDGRGGPPNTIRMRLQPGVALRIEADAPRPGDPQSRRPFILGADLVGALGPLRLAYEPVLADVLGGTRDHFPTPAAIEEAWRIVDDVLDPNGAPEPYEPGSWGPAGADQLLAGGWSPLDLGGGAPSGAE
jgi:glucose-6-phosphate 1-dehydrogenase